MDNDQLPEGAIEVVLDDGDTRASGPEPSSGQDPGASGGAQGGGNRTGFEQRIAQLTARRHDAERGENEQRERADRLDAELARQRAQIEALANRQNATDSSVQADYAARERAIQLHDLDGKVGRLAADKATAMESGEYPKAAQLDVEIAQALIEKRELEAALANPGSRSQPQPPAQQAPPQDPKLAAFQARNQDWWNRDQAKTARAWELHAEIKRTNPAIIGSDEYWQMIEQHGRGNGGGGRAPVPPLSGGGAANTGNGQRTGAPTRVVLTREQAETARGLRLAPEVYARGLLEAQQKGEIMPAGRPY